jgi:hypothetical protein
VDTRALEISLPIDKRYNTAVLVAVSLLLVERFNALPTSLARKLAGKLCWAASVVAGGHSNLYSLWDASSGHFDPKALGEQLTWWLDALGGDAKASAPLVPNPAFDILPNHWVSSRSDASGDIGCSLDVGPVVLFANWKEEQLALSIGAKELLPIVWLAEAAGHLLSGKTWHILTDNLGNVFTMLTGSCGPPGSRALFKRLWDAARRHNIAHILPTWLPREANNFMDAMSKCTSTTLALHTIMSHPYSPACRPPVDGAASSATHTGVL